MDSNPALAVFPRVYFLTSHSIFMNHGQIKSWSNVPINIVTKVHVVKFLRNIQNKNLDSAFNDNVSFLIQIANGFKHRLIEIYNI